MLTVIPISKSFSDAPNRLLGFYQTAIVLIGVYLLYRTFFKKKPSLASVVKDREEYIPTKTTKSDADWDLLSKDDKVAEFYTRFVDIVANYPTREERAGGEEEDDRGGEEGDEGGAEGTGRAGSGKVQLLLPEIDSDTNF